MLVIVIVIVIIMCIYIYIERERYTYTHIYMVNPQTAADLRTNIFDFRGLDASRIFILRGWNPQAHRDFPGNVESTNLSTDNLSREIGRKNLESQGFDPAILRGGSPRPMGDFPETRTHILLTCILSLLSLLLLALL